MSDDITTLLVKIEGHVQGVGFRAFALREASTQKLTGWVRNRFDGSVEALISGPTKRVEAFVGACMKGPAGAKVANIDLFAAAAPTEPGFIMLPMG